MSSIQNSKADRYWENLFSFQFCPNFTISLVESNCRKHQMMNILHEKNCYTKQWHIHEFDSLSDLLRTYKSLILSRKVDSDNKEKIKNKNLHDQDSNTRSIVKKARI